MKKLMKIKDDEGNQVEIDIENFYNHIMKYHNKGTSIHTENKNIFTINESFRKNLKKKYENEKN